MVGLDAAGKTTILYKLKLGEIVTTIPTIGTSPRGSCQQTRTGWGGMELGRVGKQNASMAMSMSTSRDSDLNRPADSIPISIHPDYSRRRLEP